MTADGQRAWGRGTRACSRSPSPPAADLRRHYGGGRSPSRSTTSARPPSSSADVAGGPSAGQRFSVREGPPELLYAAGARRTCGRRSSSRASTASSTRTRSGCARHGTSHLHRLAPRALGTSRRRGPSPARARGALGGPRLTPARRAAERAHAGVLGEPANATTRRAAARGRLDGIAVSRSAGELIDTYYYVQHLGPLRRATAAPRRRWSRPSLRERMLAALDGTRRGHLVLLFTRSCSAPHRTRSRSSPTCSRAPARLFLTLYPHGRGRRGAARRSAGPPSSTTRAGTPKR